MALGARGVPLPAFRGAEVARVLLLGGGIGAALALRSALAGPAVAASVPAGALFALALGGLAAAAGVRLPRLRLCDAATGVAGAALLVLPWLLARHGVTLPMARFSADLAWWTPAVVAVAVSEEAVLRGALFTALERCGGPLAALAATTMVFALVHVPLYGVGALPLDAAVGLLLGGLRLLTGGWVAPAAAHALADVAGGWL